MTARYKPYPQYKPSGVEWLGEVPEHWEVKRLKNGARLLIEKTCIENQQVVALENIEGWTGNHVATESAYKGDGILCATNDLLFGKLRPYLAKVYLCPNAVIAFGDLLAYHPHNTHPRFFFYTMLTDSFISIVDGSTYGTKMPRANSEFVGNMRLAFPLLLEQRAIAVFLDRETGKIDRMIGKQERMIELLKEKRQAVISHAVTKGIPEVGGQKSAVRMKDSGVEWLGEIPEHWGVAPLKRLVMFQRGHDLPAEQRQAGQYRVVTSGGLSDTHSHFKAKGAGIVTGRYGTIGEFYYVEEDYWPLNTALYSINTYTNNVKYLWYMLQNIKHLFILYSMKSAVPGVDRNDLHPELIAYPINVDEQANIVRFLDEATAKIDHLIAKAEQAIGLMKERRTALISAAVMGKIDVRENGNIES